MGPGDGPVTLAQAKALAQATRPRPKGAKAALADASPATIGVVRKKAALWRQQENRRRVEEYKATLEIMKKRGATKSATRPKAKVRPKGAKARPATKAPPKVVTRPLQVLAEGDSWFDYPVPFFGGGVIPRLEDRLGVPVLNLAKTGDEVRYMLGVEERILLIQQLANGCPAGGPWDVVLFSGGGNDIVDNPMALWIRNFNAATSPAGHLKQERFDAALTLVRAGFEDLIALRDDLSPGTHLVFHAYDFAIPDNRGICHLGPWLRPTFNLKGFPADRVKSTAVVKVMLQQFAAMLQSLAVTPGVTFINGQGTLAPQVSSWHNELHPARAGFTAFAELFYQKLKALFPTQVL